MIERRFWSDRAGNVAMMFGLLAIPLLLAAGVALDGFRANQLRASVQDAADSAVLAASRAKILNKDISISEAETIARRFFDANSNTNIDEVIDVFDLTPTADGAAYQLRVSGSLDTLLMKLAGIDYSDIDILSVASATVSGPVEVALVLDNTGSMEGAKLDSLQTSAKLLVDILINAPAGDYKVALVPFGRYVNVGAAHDGASWLDSVDGSAGWNGCVGSRDHPRNIDDGNFASYPALPVYGVDCPAEITPLTNSQSDLDTEIDNMIATGNTYMATGLSWGLRVISNETPFTEGMTYQERDDDDGVKSIVLMTDGANTRSASYPEHDDTSTTAADALTREACDEIKAEEIRIYTIAFEVSDINIETLMQECASADGGYFNATDSAQLEAAFRAIAVALSELSLSR